jgi:hypothetical protein
LKLISEVLEEDLLWYVDQLYSGCSNSWGCFVERLMGPKWERGFLRSLRLLDNPDEVKTEKERLLTGFNALSDQWDLNRFSSFLKAWSEESVPKGYDELLFFNHELVDLVDILLEERWMTQKTGDKILSKLKDKRLRRSQLMPTIVRNIARQAK